MGVSVNDAALRKPAPQPSPGVREREKGHSTTAPYVFSDFVIRICFEFRIRVSDFVPRLLSGFTSFPTALLPQGIIRHKRNNLARVRSKRRKLLSLLNRGVAVRIRKIVWHEPPALCCLARRGECSGQCGPAGGGAGPESGSAPPRGDARRRHRLGAQGAGFGAWSGPDTAAGSV